VIKSVQLENFKRIERQTYEFSDFDLVVGTNNSGKSTVLQALAIWQFAINAFKATKRTGNTGVQIVLPNFTALPVPEFNLLWRNKTDRAYPKDAAGKPKQEFILIKISVTWVSYDGTEISLAVQLRYHSSQTVYAIPEAGWTHFREVSQDAAFPNIAYVPPFSGLEPTEQWLDEGPIRQQVGKGQPGSILRNLLLRVSQRDIQEAERGEASSLWEELTGYIKTWFGVTLNKPEYRPGIDVNIKVEYTHDGRAYDIISGGSGFHQVLTLLAFLMGYAPSTIMLDEPDAHLHVKLQRDLLEVFKEIAQKRRIQFLTATHAEEFMNGVDPSQIISILSTSPKRVSTLPAVIQAMATVSNDEIVSVKASPFVLYLEGETDERILRAWATTLNLEGLLSKFMIKPLLGGSKKVMKDRAEDHFAALRHIVPEVRRHLILDYDGDDDAINPSEFNLALSEWRRKNIENYLIVPDAWVRAALLKTGYQSNSLFEGPIIQLIKNYFASENLTLPPTASWQNVSANIFKAVDGKKILFENTDSLFQKLRALPETVVLPREAVASSMSKVEIHDDITAVFTKLQRLALSKHVEP
jgi:predicted ATPase